MSLLQKFAQDDDPDIRISALSTLADIGAGAKEALPLVLKTLKDPSGEMRCMAAQAAWKMEGHVKSALPVLLSALKDPEDHTRVSAAFCLGLIGPQIKEAVTDLRPALKDKYGRVGFHVAHGLVQIDRADKEAAAVFVAGVAKGYMPKAYADTRVRMLRVLAQIAETDPAAAGVLRDTLRSEPHRANVALGDALKKIDRDR